MSDRISGPDLVQNNTAGRHGDPRTVTASELETNTDKRGLDIKAWDTDDLLTQTVALLQQIADEQDGDSELYDFDATSVGAALSVNHTFTAIAETRIRAIAVSATDVAKFEIFVATDGSTFVPRSAEYVEAGDLDHEFKFSDHIALPLGGKIRVTKTNRRAVGAQTLNSTIIYNTGV